MQQAPTLRFDFTLTLLMLSFMLERVTVSGLSNGIYELLCGLVIGVEVHHCVRSPSWVHDQ